MSWKLVREGRCLTCFSSSPIARETARGLLSRIILGHSAVKFNYRHWEPPAQEKHVPSEGDDYDFAGLVEAPAVNRTSAEAQRMYDAWETAADDSGRLKYNLMKVALLAASANRDDEVTPECMAAAIRFMEWQARLREVFKPSVALETAEAKFAERAMAAFVRKGGREHAINWKRVANDLKWSDRFGDRVVASGIEAMFRTGRIIPEVVEGKDGRKTKSKYLIRVRVFNKEGNDGT